MFEVPSACLQAPELFERIDFGCIGTNDLVQYLFAVDRTIDQIDCHRLYAHPALWKPPARRESHCLYVGIWGVIHDTLGGSSPQV